MNEELFTLDESLDVDDILKSLDTLLDAPDEPEEIPLEMPPLRTNGQKSPPSKPKHTPQIHIKKERNQKKWLIPTLCGVAALALAAVGVYGFLTLRDPYRRKMLPGVTVGTVDLSGMTRYQAKKALEDAYLLPLTQKPMVITFQEEGSELEAAGKHMDANTWALPPERAGILLDTAAAAADAYAIGRTQSDEQRVLPLEQYITLDEAEIRSAVQDFTQSQLDLLVPYTLGFEGPEPNLDDPQAEPQTLVITGFQYGIQLEEQTLYRTIVDAYREGSLACTYIGKITPVHPELPDLETLFDEHCFPPQEPTIDKETFQVTPGKRGYVFDTEAAMELIKDAAVGTDIRVPMMIQAPTISDEDVYFLDVLGHCETPHSTNEKRNTNLRIACAALDGLILEPGEEFSYNDTLGERTADKGYQPAPAYSGTNLVDSLGGGICQVSSTLYLASVYAELSILERVNHGFPVSYIPLGMDATVNWGFTDLKMRNDSPLPIKIHAEESDGYVRIEILGTETRDYEIEMSFSVGGRHVKTFKTKVNKETGERSPKEQVALSSYLEDVYK